MDMTTKSEGPQIPLITSFFRYNAAAMTATACDFGVMMFCRDILGIYYVVATFLGAMCGGTISFFLGRNWTYLNKEGALSKQGLKFIIIALGSVALNTLGVYLVKEGIQLEDYRIARVITATLVGAFYNFPMQRYFVFK